MNADAINMMFGVIGTIRHIAIMAEDGGFPNFTNRYCIFTAWLSCQFIYD